MAPRDAEEAPLDATLYPGLRCFVVVNRFRITGLDRYRHKLAAYPGQILAAAAAEFNEEAEETITDAKIITPVDTGNLRNSGTVLPPEFKGMTVLIKYGFGGPAAGYAGFVHEDIVVFGLVPGGGTRNFGPSRFRRFRGGRRKRIFVGQAKYLQTAIDLRRVALPDKFDAGMRRRLRTGR